MKIHLLASWPHYKRHAHAVWKHLPPEVRGDCFEGLRAHTAHVPPGDVVMVAGYPDIEKAGNHRVVYVEHGAGQTYNDYEHPQAHRHYSGGEHPTNVIGYICPRKEVAMRWDRETYVAGCPALDWWTTKSPGGGVGITFHWDAVRVCPEARSARDHYIDDLSSIVSWAGQAYNVIGHAHPRDPFGKQVWDNLGIPFEPDPDKFLGKIRLLIADNTSLAFEAAHVGLPIATLNAPWYRRDVEHGLRFWEYAPGIQVDDAWELMSENCSRYMNDSSDLSKRAGEAAFGYWKKNRGRDAARWVTDLVG